jgi:anion-transporting  ArsA/GET3 family ATPase
MSGLLGAIVGADVLVCCGPGGVGKTTVSATIALAEAAAGRRVCVLTVDPARRLADALGIDASSSEPTAVEVVGPGALDAVMLDSEGTFDQLIDRYADSPEQAESIKGNRLYQSLSSSLAGTQEYMAMEKLYELVESGRYDLVVVDTPPTRNALDLLDAPRRLTSFLENRIFRALLAPTKAYLKAVSFATRALLGTIGKVAGAELVADAVTFFQAFAGMEEGFALRAGAIHDRLRAEGTRFLLVTSPRPDSIAEARYFEARLRESGLAAGGVVVNRVHPSFPADGLTAEVAGAGGALGALAANLIRLNELAATEDLALAELVDAVAPAPVVSLPLTSEPIHDVEGLTRLAGLLGEQRDAGRGPEHW